LPADGEASGDRGVEPQAGASLENARTGS